MHSFETIPKAKENIALLKKTLSKGGFNLTKFVSNSKQNDEHCHCLLGVLWNKSTGILFYKIPAKFENNGDNYSIRKLLSLIAFLFDPLGIISPLIITFKIILKDVWKEGLAWDDSLPFEKQKMIRIRIDEYQSALPIELPRCINPLDQ